MNTIGFEKRHWRWVTSFSEVVSLLLLFVHFGTWAQVGIGTTTPQAALDVQGTASSTTIPDGVIPPRLTGDELKAKTFTSAYTGAVVYVTAIPTTTNTQTVKITRPGYYFFDGTKWNSFQTAYYASINVGDIGDGQSGTLSSTGFIAQAGGTVTKSAPTASNDTDILVTHNMNLTGLQRFVISFRSNSTTVDTTQWAKDNKMDQPVVHDVTANSFRIYLGDKTTGVGNVTMMIKLVN